MVRGGIVWNPYILETEGSGVHRLWFLSWIRWWCLKWRDSWRIRSRGVVWGIQSEAVRGPWAWNSAEVSGSKVKCFVSVHVEGVGHAGRWLQLQDNKIFSFFFFLFFFFSISGDALPLPFTAGFWFIEIRKVYRE